MEACMNEAYSINFRLSNGNTHVGVSGEFNRDTASEIIAFLNQTYAGTGNVFIDTAKIQNIVQSGADYFKSAFGSCHVPSKCLYFKGELGKNLGPDGSRLIILKTKEKKHQCCGNCKNCKCNKEHEGENNG